MVARPAHRNTGPLSHRPAQPLAVKSRGVAMTKCRGEPSNAFRARMRGFFRLVGSVGYLAGPAVVGQGLADPPANPRVRVVVAGLQGLDHGRDPGRGRAVGEGVNHVAADPRIGIPGQLEQPRPHPVVVGPDVAGAQVPARELASPALLAPGQLQQSVDSIPGCAPLAGRQADPYLLSDLAPPSHRPDDSAGRLPGPRIIPPARVGQAELTPGPAATLRHAASMHNPLFYERQRIRTGATDLTISSPCTSAIRSGLHQVSVSRTACS